MAVDRGGARHRTDVEQNTYVGLQYWTEGVEEPAMRVDFLLVLLLIETTPFSAPSIFIEGDTNTANASGVGRMDNKWHTLWGVPVYTSMRCDRFAIDDVFLYD